MRYAAVPWTATPLSHRDVRRLAARAERVPDPADDDDLTLALWARGGVDPALTGPRVLGFDAADVLA